MSVRNFSYHVPTRLVGGVGCLERLPEEVAGFSRRCLLVTGRRFARLTGLLGQLQQLLAAAGVEPVLFDQVEPNPTFDTVREGAEIARGKRLDWILAVGGGSAIDAAKAIALLAVLPGGLRDVQRGTRPDRPLLPLVAIPTTSGTGTEVTPYAILTDVQQVDKFSLSMPELFPRIAILDARLCVSMSESVTVNTGLDALSHVIEACFSLRRSPCTDVLIGDSIRRIVTFLPVARREPENLQARSEMQVASTFAGWAIANTGTLVPHALGYPITVRYDVPHGRATILLLPAFMEQVQGVEPERVAYIGELLGNRADAPGALRGLIESLGIAPRLRAYGMREDDIDLFSDKAIGKKHLTNSPGDWPVEQLRAIYRQSL